MLEYAALDLETTGLDPEHDRVIELGAVAFTTASVVGRLELLVDPGRSVPPSVLRLTGINPEELKCAPPAGEALARIREFLKGRQPVGHGAMLDTEFLRAADAWDDHVQVLDTLHLARILLPNAASHSLPLLAADLGLDQPRPHRALDDADATRQLLLRLRSEAAQLDETLKESILALVAPYEWPEARFFAEALTAPAPASDLSAAPAKDDTRDRPRGELPRDEPAVLADLLGPDGPLAAGMNGYEQREEQRQMLLAVAQTFKRGGVLMVEAGTGTGKSLAYLVPALSRALAHRERVVVSTHTHTLQEQLFGKDLPALREWLPWDFRACVLKGRLNYVSLRRWRRYLVEPCADADELRFKLKVIVWLHQTETGDRSELRLQGREEVLWNRIASDPLDCVGIHCDEEDCFVHRARAEASRADLVIVNHALLLADAHAGGGVLPEFEHLVIDEAHHLEDSATQALREEVDGDGLSALLQRLADSSGEAPTGLLPAIGRRGELGVESALLEQASERAISARRSGDALFVRIAQWALSAGERAPREESMRLRPDVLAETPELPRLAAELVRGLAALRPALGSVFGAMRDWSGGEDPELRELDMIRSRLTTAEALVHAAFVEPEPNHVYWIAPLFRTGGAVLRAAPIAVGSMLAEHVYAERSTLIFTSASLTVGGTFEHFRQRAGVPGDPESLRLVSPFNYLEQALVCLPRGVVGPDDSVFEPQLVETVADIARRIGGRTLVLFTSHQQLRDTYAELKQRDDLDEVLILGQGIDGQRRHLLKAFTESQRPLLLGTSSFWEGIDVPGDQLSCVVIVRLPFASPADPVFAARAEQYRDPFRGYALPQAVLRLKQGFGRLIRSSADRGAVVILDSRVSTREYGSAFLDALPPASIYDGPVAGVGESVERWLLADVR